MYNLCVNSASKDNRIGYKCVDLAIMKIGDFDVTRIMGLFMQF